MTHRKAQKALLIIDDDRTLCEVVKTFLASDELAVFTAHDCKKGISLCTTHKIDIVLLDQKLPDGEGYTLCPSILAQNDQTKIIFISAYPSFDSAVNALKAGAYDYISKPFDLEELQLAVERTLRTLDLERVEQFQSYKSTKESADAVFIGASESISQVRELMNIASSVDVPVLITGETGTGKNVGARFIHYSGPYQNSPFVSINCAAIPENLIEAELFGCEKGAFTGALKMRKGIFEMAEGGTLFLDEIGAMPLNLQSKLLGVLDDMRIRRLGGEVAIPVNVRIITATNTDIETAIKNETFRQDLYYRIGVMRIHMPPLRERRDDIPVLSTHFISDISNVGSVVLPDDELEKLMKYDWPGNVRELRNIIERSLILHKNNPRPSELLQKNEKQVFSPDIDFRGPVYSEEPVPLREIERDYINFVFNKCGGNFTRTAKVLGISLNTLKKKIKIFGLMHKRER
ncbi:MAG: sigma-54 dependent transcriptional regulator [Nitrospirota bacterium]|nr:sigma-54 dependent transcriptional regulator [Nitrospirota bacterium]